MTGTTGAQGSHQAPLLDVDVDGALVRLRARYDPGLVEEIKRLPGRRYVAQRTEWVVPARREALVALAGLLVELGDRATLSDLAPGACSATAPATWGSARTSSRSTPRHTPGAWSASARCPSAAGRPRGAAGTFAPPAPARWP